MFGRKKTPTAEELQRDRRYDYSTQEGRESTAAWLFQSAKNERTAKEADWQRYNDYYNFIRDTTDQMREAAEESGIPWDAAVVPDPFIMVESQVDPVVPEPEFRGRDTDMDSKKAQQRENAVKYIVQNNRLGDMNTSNEKRLKKLGDAFWKAYWDTEMRCGPYEGDIRIKDVPVQNLYADPSAGADGIQAGQYVDYVYRVHKVRFWQMYHRELTKQGLTLDDLMGSEYRERADLFDQYSQVDGMDDTIQVLEHWFKQPYDTKGAPAGAVACTIQAGGHEIKYIPHYWQRTGRQNQLFPFVHYWCVRDENEFYNKPELFSIMGLVDAADRQLATGQLNDAMMANDIIVEEEDALADGEEWTNTPGARIKVRANKANSIRRLGGLNNGVNSLSMVQFMLAQIERANRNYDTNRGRESAKVTTASGLAQLRSDADAQVQIKKADRNSGFVRLYELLDWLALEYYDDDRLIFLGAKKKKEDAILFRFNSDNFAETVPQVEDMETGEVLKEGYSYYPKVDVTVNAGDGVVRSKAATLETLDKLSAIPVTQENYKVLEAELEILDIPQKQEIIDMWEHRFAPKIPPEVTQAMEADPELMTAVMQVVAQKTAARQYGMEGVELPSEEGLPTEEEPEEQPLNGMGLPM